MASRYFNIIGRAGVAALDTADLAAWEASNPLENDLVIDLDSPAFVYWDGTAAQRIPFGGGGGPVGYVQEMQYEAYSGADLQDANLIGLTDVLGVWIDGSKWLHVINSSPIPGRAVNIDTATGTIDIGADFDENDVAIIYRSLTIAIKP